MAQTLPINFPLPNESAIASYNYTDVVQGVGRLVLYPTDGYKISDLTYYLTTEAMFSQTPSTTAPINTSLELNFDAILNTNLTLQGYCNIQIPVSYYKSSGAGTWTVTAKLYSVVSAVETQIGSTTTLTFSGSGDAKWYWDIGNAIIDCPITIIKKGSTLRLELISSAAGAASVFRFYHSPVGEDEAMSSTAGEIGNLVQTTKNILNLPIKLSL
jgi:hypothetical protein